MIKNIIFDFGGILIDIDYKKTEEELKSLLHLQSIKGKDFEEVFNRFEVGQITEKQFYDGLSTLAGINPEYAKMRKAWNAMLGDLPLHRLDLAHSLRSSYRVFLLSNTNETHISFVWNLLSERYGIDQFEEKFFDRVYYSHDIGMRKPNPEIYNYVLENEDIEAAESIFIDDSILNVEGARRVGIHGVLHDPKLEIQDCLPGYLSRSQS